MRKLADVLCDRCLYLLETRGHVAAEDMCRRCLTNVARLAGDIIREQEKEEEKDLRD